jgi:pimeloyl-ACP methyl ester carboxylesterase
MSRAFELRFNVSDTLPSNQEAALAATVVAPNPGVPVQKSLIVAVPGGSYSRSYWNPGTEALPAGFNFCEYLANQGYVVVALDNLATGSSTRPEGVDITPELMGDAIHAAAREIRIRASAGTLIENLEPIQGLELVGVGHSMGGLITLLQQANHGSYDRIAILGYTVFRSPDQEGISDAERLKAAIEHIRNLSTPEESNADLVRLSRNDLKPLFYGPFVDDDVMAADEQTETVMPVLAGAYTMVSGYAAEAAGRIRVPVLLAFGEVDVAFAPHDEPGAYRVCDDITLFELSGSAHCHNLAPTRTKLWGRLVAWLN